MLRPWNDCCKIGRCKDRLTALILYGATEEEWESCVAWSENGTTREAFIVPWYDQDDTEGESPGDQ